MDSCSTASRHLAEPLAGSAPEASRWLLLEQPGPWGRDALTMSHLDPAVGQQLKDWANAHAIRIGLIRRPGQHADGPGRTPRRTVLIADCDPSSPRLVSADLADPRDLLGADPASLMDAGSPVVRQQDVQPSRVLAVCTNGKRDRCCALRGRQVVATLDADLPGQVWETSHLSGHRFSPTLVSLPDGYLYGGPDAARLTTAACRGRSTLSPAAQAVEVAALEHLAVSHPRPLDVTPVDSGHWRAHDSIAGRSLLVEVRSVADSTPRPESCRKPPAPWTRLSTQVVG